VCVCLVSANKDLMHAIRIAHLYREYFRLFVCVCVCVFSKNKDPVHAIRIAHLYSQ
jgi:hypothetical protein